MASMPPASWLFLTNILWNCFNWRLFIELAMTKCLSLSLAEHQSLCLLHVFHVSTTASSSNSFFFHLITLSNTSQGIYRFRVWGLNRQSLMGQVFDCASRLIGHGTIKDLGDVTSCSTRPVCANIIIHRQSCLRLTTCPLPTVWISILRRMAGSIGRDLLGSYIPTIPCQVLFAQEFLILGQD